MRHPIEIVGGGLAGLALGTALQRAGVSVTVHEAGDYPRHRVCGEFITGLGANTIARLGLDDALAGALVHREVAWSLGEAAPLVQRLPSPALGLSRFRLDARLAGALVASGGNLLTRSRVTPATSASGRIWATGRRRTSSGPWIGLKVQLRDIPLERDLEMHLGDQGYVGLTRVNDAVNVCGLFRRRAVTGGGVNLLVTYLRAIGLFHLAGRIDAADIVPGSCCAVAGLAFPAPAGATDNFLCIGDLHTMTPPFTGNGMTMALQSAETALPLILDYARGERDWTETIRRVAAALRRRFRRRLAFAHALHPCLLHPGGQRWLQVLARAHLLPLGPLYAAVH